MRKNDRLKVIGLGIMIVDHVALFLFGGYLPLYMVARFIGFPFFAYGIAVGASNTRDPLGYIKRLFLFGLLCQPFFFYATDQARLNVVFTLALGASCIYLWRLGSLPLRVAALLLPLVGGSWADPAVGYGFYGIYMILFFGLGRSASLAFHSVAAVWFALVGDVQSLALFSVLFVYWLPIPHLKLPRWVYYVSYPGHLALIALIRPYLI